jgi:nucleotide-binding universal stress UspA family protein
MAHALLLIFFKHIKMHCFSIPLKRRTPMQLIQKIMVAVDQSDYSLPLVQYAHQIAQSLGAKIILVNVYNRRDVSAVQKAINAYDHDLCDTIIKENKAQRYTDLENLVKAAGAEETVSEKFIRVGTPYQELLNVIEEEKPNLLIMGTKGRSNLADTVVGSCAQKMYRRSPIPMLSIR